MMMMMMMVMMMMMMMMKAFFPRLQGRKMTPENSWDWSWESG